MNRNDSESQRGPAAADCFSGICGVTSARAQFDAAAAKGSPARASQSGAETVFTGFDWSNTVGRTMQAATVRLDGRRDGAREVMTYDLDGTGLFACRDEDADGRSISLHFVSASSRAAYERALSSVGYLNRAAHPHEGERRFNVEVTDATGFPVRIGERALWVDAPAEAAADDFDTLSPEIMRFDLGDEVGDAAIAFDDDAFALPADEPGAPKLQPQSAPTALAAKSGDRFAGHYGAGGYWIHKQSPARAAAATGSAQRPARAPSLFGDTAEIYHIYRPAGAIATPGQTSSVATLVAETPDAFAGDDRVRVFRRRAPAPGTVATTRHETPAATDRDALHLADVFEGEIDPNGLERDPARQAERDFLFGLGRTRAA